MTEQDRQSARSVAYSIKTFCEQAGDKPITITLSNGDADQESMTIASSDMIQIDRGGVKSPAYSQDDRDIEVSAELIRSGGSALSWKNKLFPLHRPLTASISSDGTLRIESGRAGFSDATHLFVAKAGQ